MGSAGASVFSTSVVPSAPEDPLFGLAQAYRQDPSDKKVDLVIGAYRDDNAKPWVLPVVKKVCPEVPLTGHELRNSFFRA
jgi:aspartate aminotransferase